MLLTQYNVICYIVYIAMRYGRLAQLVRASGLHPECREFDPLTVQEKGLQRNEVLFCFKFIHIRVLRHERPINKQNLIFLY